jgi:hypothetical protein
MVLCISRTRYCDWLLESKADDHRAVTFKHKDAIVIANNIKGYDKQFVLNYLVHKVILNSSKKLYMEDFGLKFIDSYPHPPPCALAKMSAAFRLSELRKNSFSSFCFLIWKRTKTTWDHFRPLFSTFRTACRTPTRKPPTPYSISGKNF